MFTTQLIGGSNVRIGADGTAQTRADGTIKRAARGYIVTDPVRLMGRLEAQGWEARIAPGRGQKDYGNRVAVVIAKKPGLRWSDRCRDNYVPTVSFLADHRGREAFRIMPTIWRQGCLNEFMGCPIKVNHMDKELYDVLKNPGDWAERALRMARCTLAQLGELQGRPYGRNFMGFLQDYRPRVAKKAWNHWPTYVNRDGGSVWSALQCYTNTHHAAGVRLVQDGLARHFECLYNGEVPQEWIRAMDLEKERKRARKAKKDANLQ